MVGRILVSMAVGILALAAAFGEEPTAKKAAKELKAVEKSLRSLTETLEPKPQSTFDNNGTSLTMTYQTQKFKIHGRNKGGNISEETHDEVGPSHLGFILRVHMQRKGEINQAVTPQTIREPYWKTDLNVTRLAGSDQQLYWSLSYGSRADETTLDAIRKAIEKLEE